MDQFNIDNRDLKKLIKFYEEAPKAFKAISASVLNSLAFEDRKLSMRQLGKGMIIRNPGLLKKGTRVQMAKSSDPISRQHAISGSVSMRNHDAWEAVEQGSTTRATQFSTAGRSGSEQNVGMRAARQGLAQVYTNDFDMKGSGDRRMLIYMQQIQADKTRRRKTFYMPRRYKRMTPGIYKFMGGRTGKYKGRRTLVGAIPVRLSTPSNLGSSVFAPKPIHWKQKATHSITENDVKRFWVDGSQRYLQRLAR